MTDKGEAQDFLDDNPPTDGMELLEEMRRRAVSVEMMAERAWRHGYELDPAEVLETLTGSYPSK